MIKIDVRSTRLTIRSQEPLTVGLVGATVQFSFSESWKTLGKIAVFRQGQTVKDQILTGEMAQIPQEALQQPGIPLEIGVYGTDATGGKVIPTLWVRTNPVQPGANPVDDPGLEPTAQAWQQALGGMGQLQALETQNKADLVSAINETNRVAIDAANRVIEKPTLQFTVQKNQAGTASIAEGYTVEDLVAAKEAGKALLCFLQKECVLLSPTLEMQDELHFIAVAQNTEYAVRVDRDGVFCSTTILVSDDHDHPAPQKLTFTGAVEAQYDGSKPLTVNIPTGGSPAPGADGGYYTPVVEQVDETTMKVSFTANKDGMEAVDAQTILLPSGKDGLDATPVTPLFANSIEECTDTTKPYVLPDGYIYAYMMTEVEEEKILYTNRLPLAEDGNGDKYNGGQGWKTNTRLSSGGGEATSSATGMEVTGFIPFQKGHIIRFSGITMNKNSANKERCYFNQYDSSKTLLNSWNVSAFNTAIGAGRVLVDADSNILQINTGDFPSDAVQPITENARFFRISADEINADSIITINEEIKSTTVITKKEGWANTGHAFVPADYEGRIIAVEAAAGANRESVESHEARIRSLEGSTVDGVPDYVISEAEAVIDRVIAAQGSRTFTFAAITDLHYGEGSYTEGIHHACQAMKHIDSRMKLDAVAVLGDYTNGHAGEDTDYADAISDFKAINSELNGLRFAPNLRIYGNHDFCGTHSPVLHRYITAYSDDVVWGSKPGGYFYRDFEDFKLRVICLNTAEQSGDGVSCTTEQYNWFASVLDLSGKENAAQWQTLILSHHPLDWFMNWNVEGSTGYVFWQILNAYLNGTAWSGFDFAGKNSAKLVGNIHGHIHNLLTRKLAAGQPNTTDSTINVVRIATPEACYGRPNSYNGDWDYNPFGEETSYPKTKGTAKDTAFCIYCIDLDTRTIKAICYGAGYDREISY